MNRLSTLFLFCGCTGAAPLPPPSSSGDADADADVDADADTDGDVPEGCDSEWRFRTGPDSVLPGEQEYRCWIERAPASGYATRMTPAIPEDDQSVMHHIVLMRSGPLGMVDCMAAEAFNPLVFGGGLATGALEMPPGVGLPVEAGEEFILQFHVTNATDEPVEFDVGVDLCLVDTVEHEAGTVVWGPQELDIPDDGELHTFESDCAVTGEDRNFFAAFGHMHQLGVRTEIGVGGVPFATVDPWDFSNQPMLMVDPQVVAHPGDALTATCTYLNPVGNGDVTWGPWSEDEMCLPGAYYWPAGLRNCFEF